MANGRFRRRVVGALAATTTAVAVVVGAVSGPVAAAPPTADGPTAAAYATAWLAQQLDAQIPMQNFGSPSWGVTLDAALGMAAAGSGGEQLDAVWAELLANRETVVGSGGIDDPGRLARVILLAVATGRDPRSVGAAPGNDLVARLQALRQASGPDTGLFGPQNPTYDGAYRQGYALAALVAAGVEPEASSVEWLLAQQCGPEADGGAWMPYRSDLSVPCAVDAEMFVGPDTNATAAAITGLTSVGAGAAAVETGLDWLDTVQEVDGGWGQMVGYGTDPNSTALVLQALLAADAADDARFGDRSATPLGALLSFQLGCDALEGDRGAFTYPGSNDAPNGFATAQAVGAVAGSPLLSEPTEVSPGVTPLDCTPVTTTTSVPPTTAVPATAAAPTTAPGVTAAPEVAGASQTAPVSELALTGDASAGLAAAGAAAILCGLGLLVVARRRSDA
jgi:LPXTG-motif cell wall-anchored protein